MRNAFVHHPEDSPGLSPLRYFKLKIAIQTGYIIDFTTQRCPGKAYLLGQVNIVAMPLKDRMFLNIEHDIKVTRQGAFIASFPLTLDFYDITAISSLRDGNRPSLTSSTKPLPWQLTHISFTILPRPRHCLQVVIWRKTVNPDLCSVII